VNTNWLGQEIELTVGKVAHGGVFVARHENRVIFVTGAIPGEKVIARVFEDKGGSFARAETIQVIDASGDRVPHFWKKSAIAGGAEFGHISLERQRSLKSEVLTEAFERFAKLNLETVIESIDTDPSGLGYRTRVQLHVNEFGDAGPYRERSHEVIKVKELPLAVAEIQELGLHLKNWQSVKKISIASSNTGGLQWQVDRKVQGDPMLIESVLGRTYRLSPGLKRLEKLATGSTVVLDPPRSGAGNKVIAELLRLQPAAIIYVACDPVALARDLGQLVPAGYKIDNIRALDLFPHTHHFETVVSLVR